MHTSTSALLQGVDNFSLLYYDFLVNFQTTITSKRQITIPAALFKELGLVEGQKLLAQVVDKQLVFKPAIALVEQLAGSVPIPARFKGKPIDEIIELAKMEYFSQHSDKYLPPKKKEN